MKGHLLYLGKNYIGEPHETNVKRYCRKPTYKKLIRTCQPLWLTYLLK